MIGAMAQLSIKAPDQRFSPAGRAGNSSMVHNASVSKWVLETCDLLLSNSWQSDRHLLLDMSYGWAEDFREEAAIAIFQALGRNTSARVFKLKNVHVSLKIQKALEDMLHENATLTSVTMDNLKDNGSQFLLPASLVDATIGLEKFEIIKCKLDRAGFAALGRLIQTSLKFLKLSQVALIGNIDSFTAAIAELSNDACLQHLDLSEFKLCPDSLSLLLESLAKNNSLRSLVLENMGLGDENAATLAEHLQKSSRLETLSLRKNDLSGSSIQMISEKGIRHNSILRSLDLSYNPIGDDGARHLANALIANTTLRDVNIENAEIWRAGCLALARGLGNMTALRTLLLSGNEVDNCASDVLESLSKNMTIKHVGTNSLGASVVYDDGMDQQSDATKRQWKEVDLLLRLNRANRRVLTESNLSSALWPTVLAVVSHDLDMLHYMLRHAPQLHDARR